MQELIPSYLPAQGAVPAFDLAPGSSFGGRGYGGSYTVGYDGYATPINTSVPTHQYLQPYPTNAALPPPAPEAATPVATGAAPLPLVQQPAPPMDASPAALSLILSQSTHGLPAPTADLPPPLSLDAHHVIAHWPPGMCPPPTLEALTALIESCKGHTGPPSLELLDHILAADVTQEQLVHILAQCSHPASRQILDAMLYQSAGLAARLEQSLAAGGFQVPQAGPDRFFAGFLEPPPWGSSKDLFKEWAGRVSADVVRRRTHDCTVAKVRCRTHTTACYTLAARALRRELLASTASAWLP